MKDSSVRPVGLFDPKRQQQLLAGLDDRLRSCSQRQRELEQIHAKQRVEEDSVFTARREAKTEQCRRQRRSMLTEWDEAEEQLTHQYEKTTVQTQQELFRLRAVLRRKRAEKQNAVGRKVEARRQAVLQQYENGKNLPGQQKRKDVNKIDEALQPIHQNLERGRALTIRRLDRLPDVPPVKDSDDDMRRPTPKTVEESFDTVRSLARDGAATISEMQQGMASKIIDSLYLPLGVAAFIIVWALCAFSFGPRPPWIPMAIGIPIAGVLGFAVYIVLLLPLKSMTRQLYPRLERIAQAAEDAAAKGRKITTENANKASLELRQRRDAHIDAADRWLDEQEAELDAEIKAEETSTRDQLDATINHIRDQYVERFESVHQSMHDKADELAEQITSELSEVDRVLQQERDAKAAHRQAELRRLASRLRTGADVACRHMIAGQKSVNNRFPDWQTVLGNIAAVPETLDFLPLGSLRVTDRLRQTLHTEEPSADRIEASGTNQLFDGDADATVPDSNGQYADANLISPLAGVTLPETIPVVLHRRGHNALVISAPHQLLPKAIELAHQVLWRLISGVSPSRARLTLIDPLGRGQHFTSFMSLADHDPALVGHRVWTTENKIDERLGELAHHVEDVLQSSLRDRFQRIEDYNELAGSMAEPYRAVAAIGLPESLTRNGYKHLRALIESGPRCGIFTVLVCDQSKPWPADMPMPTGGNVMQVRLDPDGSWHLRHKDLEELPFEPAPTPPDSLRSTLIEHIGSAAIAASRVEIPLDSILTAGSEGKGNTDEGIDILIGSQGANRSLGLSLGEGVRQHVLIAGKTGSGKSTLLHSIITSGVHRYRPDQLQFYLLDFKKGVEFKPYAETHLPHARVIGIESEREFGRSVLQRLDEELQSRGEKFRAHSVQELSEYRRASNEAMPRIMLVVDEFQELFVRDDRLAGDCAMLLDRLVRQGRSFGMHVILSSQSLAGAYSLPRATLGQMAVRIAMQCSEADAALILSDDNTAARLISRPGEAIYNDAGGLVEGNQPFQVAWLSSTRHREMLSAIAARDELHTKELPPPVVFEGNRPCQWSETLADAAIEGAGEGNAIQGLLGESVEIGPPTALPLSRTTGRNVLLITPPTQRQAVLSAALSGFVKSAPETSIVYLDGNRADDGPSLVPWLHEAGIEVKHVKTRDAESELTRLRDEIKHRGDEPSDASPIVLIIDPLERFRDLRQDDSFNFSLDAAGSGENGSSALQSILRDGPSANVFVILVCGSADTLTRWLPRSSHHDLELRILGRMNASDSSQLIDSPAASELSAATLMLYDDADGRISKFRLCDVPQPSDVKQWLGNPAS